MHLQKEFDENDDNQNKYAYTIDNNDGVDHGGQEYRHL